MQIKVRNRKLYIFGKFCSNFFFWTLFFIIFLFEAANTFSTNFSKICCSFTQNENFEKSKMAVKMRRTCCETTVAIVTVLN